MREHAVVRVHSQSKVNFTKDVDASDEEQGTQYRPSMYARRSRHTWRVYVSKGDKLTCTSQVCCGIAVDFAVLKFPDTSLIGIMCGALPNTLAKLGKITSVCKWLLIVLNNHL